MTADKTIAVLGANGRLGREAAKAFLEAGWKVRAITRKGNSTLPGVENRVADAMDAASVAKATAGCRFIFHGLNPIYTQWRGTVVTMVRISIDAAKANGATILFPGNVYNYGKEIPHHPDEVTPHVADHEKAAIRIEAESLLQSAAGDGVQTIILRAGDFFGGEGTGSWFDQALTSKIKSGKVVWPGKGGIVHAWAYLPDLSKAFVALADKADALPSFATFNFGGHNVTLEQMHAAIEKAVGKSLKPSALPWWMLRLASPFVPMARELSAMSYLWRRPHALSGARLETAVGKLKVTPLDEAVAATLVNLGYGRTNAKVGAMEPAPTRSVAVSR